MIWRIAGPFSLVLSMGAALIMLGCGAKNNTPADSAPVPGGTPADPAASHSAPATVPATALTAVPVSTLLPIVASGTNPRIGRSGLSRAQ